MRSTKCSKSAKITVVGLAYYPNIDDPRESPGFVIIDRILRMGAVASYHDPHILIAPRIRSMACSTT